jgi:cysteine desulfurase/selenocysteine lyase
MYFDNASTSFPKPDSVCDAVDRWMRHGAASAGRGSHQGAEEAARLVDSCRMQLASFIGLSKASQLVFTFNCTDSLNIVLQGYLRPGDRVIASAMDHNSVLRPLEMLTNEAGVKLTLIDFDPASGLLDEDELVSHLNSEPTSLVVLTHASNVTGRIQPVRRLTELAHAAGAKVLLDAAQTVGHGDVDIMSLDVDFLAAAGHKGLLGPLGTGLLAIRNGLESSLRPLRYGGTGTASESLEQPEGMPSRFESGNMNLPGIAGLLAAVAWLTSPTSNDLQKTLHQQVRRLRTELAGISGVRMLTPDVDDVVPLVTFTINNYDCRDVAMILDQSFNIQSRAGLHCAPLAHQTLGTFDSGGGVRLSPGIFTTDEEITAAIDAVRQIAIS